MPNEKANLQPGDRVIIRVGRVLTPGTVRSISEGTAMVVRADGRLFERPVASLLPVVGEGGS